MAETRRTVVAMTRTMIPTDGLDPHWVEIIPDAGSLSHNRHSDNWSLDHDSTVRLLNDQDDKIAEWLPWEAQNIALGILHALYVAGEICPKKLLETIEGWRGQEWNGTVDNKRFSSLSGVNLP